MTRWIGTTIASLERLLPRVSLASIGSTTGRTLADRFTDVYDARDYGLREGGDPDDNADAIQAAMDAGAAARGITVLRKGTYEIGHELITSSNLTLVSEGAVLKPVNTGLGRTKGSIITNLYTSNDAASIQSNITIAGLQMDFADYPDSPYGTAQGGSANTIILAASDPATEATIVGKWILLCEGTGADLTEYRAVSAYDSGTKTATITGTWIGASPDNTTVYQWGWNDNALGFVAGVSDIRILNTRITNLPHMWRNQGSKGINFEQGVEGWVIDGLFVSGRSDYPCLAGLFIQGRSGTYGNGAKRNNVLGRATNLVMRNCSTALAVGGADTDEELAGDPDQELVIIDGLVAHNCGHMPYRMGITALDHQKSGVITLFRAQNVVINNVNVYNDSTYPDTSPGYPTDFPLRVGYGLSGPVGAVIWGWGRNVTINNIQYHGAADHFIRINRGRALGEDGWTVGPGAPINVYDLRVKSALVVGALTDVLAVDSTASARVLTTELKIDVAVDLAEASTVTALVSHTGYTLANLDIHDRATGTRVLGKASEIFTAGNTIATFTAAVETNYRLNKLNNIAIAGTLDVTGVSTLGVVNTSNDITATRATTTRINAVSTNGNAGFKALSSGTNSAYLLLQNATGERARILANDSAHIIMQVDASLTQVADFCATSVTLGSGAGVTTITGAASTAGASLRMPHGTAPTSPVNGDMWTTTSGLYVRINGSTVGPLS